MSLAKITIIGNLGRDPEARYTPNGKLIVSFSIAASRKWTDADGQQQDNTTWFAVSCFGKLAETVMTLQERGWLGKGKQIYLEGRIESRGYTANDGTQRTSLDVAANEIQLLGGRADTAGGDRRDDARQALRQGGESYEDMASVPF